MVIVHFLHLLHHHQIQEVEVFLLIVLIVGYIKNIVIPVSVNKIYEGRIILCLIIAKSINGKLLLFSIVINTPNDKEDRPKDNRTNEEFEMFPVSNKVNPIKNVVIVTERNMPPLMSILLFFFFY